MNAHYLKTLAFSVATLALVSSALVSSALAQSWPTRPITLTLGYPPGGATDLVGRTIAEKLRELAGQPVIVDYRPGANTQIASDHVRGQIPDGHSLYLVATVFTLAPATNPTIHTYSPATDFTAIGRISSTPMVLIANAKQAFSSTREVVDYARKNPGKLNAATTGQGSIEHLAGLLLESKTGTKFTHVAYKGGAAALQDLLGGTVDIRFESILTARPFIDQKRVKALGVTFQTRVLSMPNVPAIAEDVPGFEVAGYYGLVGPKGIPTSIVGQINRELVALLRSPEIDNRLRSVGTDPLTSTPEEFRSFLDRHYTTWASIVKESGLKFE